MNPSGTMARGGSPLAQEITVALQANQVARITRWELRAMINRGDWFQIGKLFAFDPVLTRGPGGRAVIDWRCVPETVSKILQDKPRTFSLRRVRRPAKNQRLLTFQLQRGTCYYCEQPTPFSKWTIDHKTPRSRGGGNHFSNKVGACLACNGQKANLTEAEFRCLGTATERKAKIRSLRPAILTTDEHE